MNKIESLKDLKCFLAFDLNSQGGGNFFFKFLKSSIFRYTCLLRFNELLVNRKWIFLLRAIPYLLFRRLGTRLGFSIPFNVCDYGLGIVHYGLLIISPDAQIGKNCRIHAGVNIGGSAGFKKDGDLSKYAPIIGDNCYIGPGAKLFGKIVLGNNIVVGANSVVNKSFIGDCTVAGIPARKISNKNSRGLVYEI